MAFIVRRLCAALVTLLLVPLLCFAAFRVIPGDAALLGAGTGATEAQLKALRADLGLEKSLPAQYLSWAAGFFTGSLGNSFRFRGAPVSGLIRERLPVTFTLAALSLLLALGIAVPLALLGGRRAQGAGGRIINVMTSLGLSFPGFFLGVLLIWGFGLVFRVFSPGLFVSYRESAAGFLGCLFFPALAVAIPNAALIVKFLYGSIQKEWQAGYVRTALSKGCPRPRVLFHHILKNAALPAVTALGMIAGEVFSGSIVIEQVFSIPGLGRLLVGAIAARDYPVVQSLAVYLASIVIAANTLADIAMQVIDPRIRMA
ncbi:MAG: ABC transporter permease [Treponema sp.]|jgi:ABC-type dipeptide/oligopeptide/nickel transport system permease component|nr:ABC transporter permease [Treponema sp.]